MIICIYLFSYLSIRSSVHLSICLPACPLACFPLACLFDCLSIYPVVRPSFYLPACPLACLPLACLFDCLSIYPVVHPSFLSACLPARLHASCLSIWLSIYLSGRPSIFLSACLPARLLASCLFIWLSIYLSFKVKENDTCGTITWLKRNNAYKTPLHTSTKVTRTLSPHITLILAHLSRRLICELIV